MADSKITCPECDSVLRFPKPIPPGKPVKCPECDAVFRAPAEKVPAAKAPAAKGKAAPEAPAKSKPKTAPEPAPKKASDKVAAKKPAAKPAAKPPAGKAESKPAKPESKPAKGDDEEENTYGVVKEEAKEEEDKPKISYAPDTSIKDLRGPAQEALMRPTNYLLIVGALGFIGWCLSILILLILVLTPISSDEGAEGTPREVLGVGIGLGSVGATADDQIDWDKIQDVMAKAKKALDAANGPDPDALLVVGGVDIAGTAAALAAVQVALDVFLLAFFAVFSGLTAIGASKAQNMESRAWGITASILAIIPIASYSMACLAMLPCIPIALIPGIGGFIVVIVFLTCLLLGPAAGIYGLVVLNKEEVIAGFEYEPED